MGPAANHSICGRRSALLLTTIFILTTGIPSTSVSDDGYVSNVSGSARLMDEHPSISLLAEHVSATVSPKKIDVNCVFVLHNDGPSTSVTMGFPDYSSGATPRKPFRNFETFVNGVKTEAELSGPEVGTEMTYYWWVKTVDFASNETKIIEDRYTATPGGDISGRRFFVYELYTGASWAGDIDAASIVVRFEDIDVDYELGLAPTGFNKHGNEVRWFFSELEPEQWDEYGRIYISWLDPEYEKHEVRKTGVIVQATLIDVIENTPYDLGKLRVDQVLKGKPDQFLYFDIRTTEIREGDNGIWLLEEQSEKGKKHHLIRYVAEHNVEKFKERTKTTLGQ